MARQITTRPTVIFAIDSCKIRMPPSLADVTMSERPNAYLNSVSLAPVRLELTSVKRIALLTLVSKTPIAPIMPEVGKTSSARIAECRGAVDFDRRAVREAVALQPSEATPRRSTPLRSTAGVEIAAQSNRCRAG